MSVATSRRFRLACLAAVSTLAIAASGIGVPPVRDVDLVLGEHGRLHIGAIRTDRGLLGIAAAQVPTLQQGLGRALQGIGAGETVTLDDVTLDLGFAIYRMAKVEVSGSSLSRAELMSLFDKNASEPLAARVGRLSAKEIRVPELDGRADLRQPAPDDPLPQHRRRRRRQGPHRERDERGRQHGDEGRQEPGLGHHGPADDDRRRRGRGGPHLRREGGSARRDEEDLWRLHPREPRRRPGRWAAVQARAHIRQGLRGAPDESVLDGDHEGVRVRRGPRQGRARPSSRASSGPSPTCSIRWRSGSSRRPASRSCRRRRRARRRAASRASPTPAAAAEPADMRMERFEIATDQGQGEDRPHRLHRLLLHRHVQGSARPRATSR